MINQQRYLRERKEVQAEEELDEMNRFGAAIDKSGDARAAAQQRRLFALKSKFKTGGSKGLSDAEHSEYFNLARKAGETAPKQVADKHAELTGKKPTGALGSLGGDKPAGDATKLGDLTGDKGVEDKHPAGEKSMDSIKGESISEIISSAGGSNASQIISYIQSILSSEGIKLKGSLR